MERDNVGTGAAPVATGTNSPDLEVKDAQLIFGRHFAPKEVSGQVVFFSHSTGLCSRPDHLVGEKTTPNSVSINRVHPDLVSTIFQRILPSQRQGSSFRNTVRPKIRTGIDRLFGDIE